MDMPSKAIRAIAYDAARNELTVTFVRGPTYVYSLVPAALAEAFATSEAKGVFHNANVRDHYPFRKAMSPPRAKPSSLLDQLRASADMSADETGVAPVKVGLP
jgi:hypothetical protein